MNRLRLAYATASLLTASLMPPAIGQADPLKIEWNDSGIETIRHNGKLFYQAPEKPNKKNRGIFFGSVMLSAPGSDDMEKVSPFRTATTHTFDRQTLTEKIVFPQGVMNCRYEQQDGTLHFFVTVSNSTPDRVMHDMRFRLIAAEVPRTYRNITNQHQWSTSGLDEAPDIAGMFDSRGGVVGLSNYEYGKPVQWGLGLHRNRTRRGIILQVKNPKPPMHPVFNLDLLRKPNFSIPAGESRTMHVALNFSDAHQTSVTQLCTDVLDAFREANPFRLDWPDRRPIGALFVAQAGTQWPNNPRGYVTGLKAKEDVTTPEGREQFRKGVMQYADNSINILKKANAQGVIIWDIEGQEYPHFISYIGQPDLLPEIAPEMEPIADAFFRKFTDAGLRVGICIRPTEAFVIDSKEQREAYPYKIGEYPVWHRQVPDPGALMNRKIAYAKERWGATLFYLDSNGLSGFADPKDGSKAKIQGIGGIPTSMYARALEGHDDVLLIPEWSSPSSYAYSAPYFSPNLGQINMPPLARYIYPDGFPLINTGYHLLQSRWDEYEKEVRHGSVLAFNAWYRSGEFLFSKAIYDTVAYKEAGPPESVATAELESLSHVAAAADSTLERYWAIRRLGQASVPAAIPALLNVLQEDDEDLALQKAATYALGRLPLAVHQADQSGVEKLMQIVLRAKGDQRQMRHFAAAALAEFPQLSAQPLFEELVKIKEAGNPHALNQIVGFAAQALESHPNPDTRMIETLIDVAASTSTLDGTRTKVVQVLGSWQARAAVPALIKLLEGCTDRKSESFSCDLVEALGKIGDKRAVPAILDTRKRRYTSVAVYRIGRVRQTALKAITGKNLMGKEWETWWNQEQQK